MMHAMRFRILVTLVGITLLSAWTFSAETRGVHGLARISHGSQFAGDRHHGNDSYIKAASDERDKLLTTKLKSVCRGC